MVKQPQFENEGHYVVISAANNPHKRFCVRLIHMDHDNSNVSLLADSEHCPLLLAEHGNESMWSFDLTRTSK